MENYFDKFGDAFVEENQIDDLELYDLYEGNENQYSNLEFEGWE